MKLNSTSDLAAWVLKAPIGARNVSIKTHMTGALPETFAAFVRALDRESYIRAFWRKSEDDEGKPLWRWELTRMKRKALRNNLNDLLATAAREAANREILEDEE